MFPCLRSLLDPAALLALISRDYRLTGLERVVLLRSLVNDVYRVDTTDRTYVLKVYRSGWRSPDEVAWEVDLIAHLHRAGVAVSPPVARTDGDPIGVIDAPEGPRPAMLSEFTAGSDPPQPFTGPLYRDFGRRTGRASSPSPTPPVAASPSCPRTIRPAESATATSAWTTSG